ncbi:MAG TPA: hypothetical protein VOA80_16915 [Thermoanaerobaculia bacterium]|nr:hypothetical protein [Thermoanaerobaculia bacterium]
MPTKLPQRRTRSSSRVVWFYYSNSPHQEFDYYGGSYLRAARTLARSLRRQAGFYRVSAAPVLFMYRHAVELLLKSIIVRGYYWLSEDSVDDEASRRSLFRSIRQHRLSPLLSRASAVFEQVGWEWWWPLHPSVKTLEQARELLRQVDNLDQGSFAFRYPVDTYGQRLIPTDVQFNFDRIVSALDALAEALDTANFGLAAQLEA